MFQVKQSADFKPDESEQAHQQVFNGEQHHEGKFSHEFAAGAASFGAMKAYEDHQRKNGLFHPVSCHFESSSNPS